MRFSVQKAFVSVEEVDVEWNAALSDGEKEDFAALAGAGASRSPRTRIGHARRRDRAMGRSFHM
jgi:hypothetical protein